MELDPCKIQSVAALDFDVLTPAQFIAQEYKDFFRGQAEFERFTVGIEVDAQPLPAVAVTE